MTATAPQQALVWRGLPEIPARWPACAVTIGVFDGLHRGHSQLIERTRQIAATRGLPTVLVTFDPHPARVLKLPKATASLTTVDTRARLAHQLGVDAVCVLPFTPELARVSAEEFVKQVLVSRLHAAAVIVGANFTFGYQGRGDIATLHRLGQEHGFLAHALDLVHTADEPCSSTYIRGCLRRGDVKAAAHALGRPHQIIGTRAANGEVIPNEDIALPTTGHYTGRMEDHTVTLEVTSQGTLLTDPVAPAGRPATVQFVDRKA